MYCSLPLTLACSVSGVLLTPLDVVRTRLQLSPTRISFRQALRALVAEAGVKFVLLCWIVC